MRLVYAVILRKPVADSEGEARQPSFKHASSLPLPLQRGKWYRKRLGMK
jgi:hypothetical protein